ncbi:MAG: hypothetical protein M1170_02990 [Patescibacteria group bacterium]|nr:hypothetical protein [Patescibacteria group bacterium]
MKISSKNKFLFYSAVLAGVLVAGGVPTKIHAELIGEITSVAVYQSTLALSYLFGKIASAFFTFCASLVDLALRLNSLLLISPIVKNGWKFILNFTNLGFVLGIIVIAFATILRLENYAIKQTLWKLIVAALLVNFSLVIAGAFISVSDLVTDNFNNYLNNVPMSDKLTGLLKIQTLNDPFTNSGNVATTTGAEAYSRVLLKGVDIVNAPINLLFGTNLGAERSAWGNNKSILEMITGKASSSEGLLLLVSSFIFVVIFTFLAALTYLAIAIMLFVRYVFLGILLVLSPIVWLLWIFPSTSLYWKKWWDNFLRWTFFAPVMMFFMILTIVSLGNPVVGDPISPDGHQIFIDNMAKKQKGLEFDFMKMGNLVVVMGILWGGLMAANSMGIAGANVAMNLASKAGKGAGAWAGRRGLQLGTAPLRTKWFGKKGEEKSVGEKAVEWASKTGWIGRHTLGYAARGITRLETAGGENILKQHAKSVANMSDADLKASVLTVSGPRKIAATKELQKRKLLGDVDAKNLITDESQALFGRFRQGVSWGDVEHGAKMNIKMAKQLRDTGEASEDLVREFTATYKGKDIEASAIKDLYGGKAKLGLSQDSVNKLGAQFAKTFAMENHQMVPKIIPTMSAKERAIFSQHYEDQILTLPNEWMNRNNRRVTLQEVNDAWNKTMSNYAMGFSSEAPIAGTTPPPSTP